MSIAAASGASTSTASPVLSVSPQQFYKTRQADLQQLGKDLGTGDVSGAQAEYQDIVSLGKEGPFSSGKPFAMANREQDFTAIGQALQSGNLTGAQQAFASLKGTFANPVQDPITPIMPIEKPVADPLVAESSGSGASTSTTPSLNIASLEGVLSNTAASSIAYESLSVTA
jgi:hypothetical protein